MKKRKRQFLKLLTLLGTTGLVVATPIITTSCKSASSDNNQNIDNNQKVSLALNSNVDIVGSIDALLDGGKNAIGTILEENPSKLISNYDDVKSKMGDISITTTLSNTSEDNKWGDESYGEWNKTTEESDKKTNTELEKIYYSSISEPLTITSKNDLHEKLNKNLPKILTDIDSKKFKEFEAKLNPKANIHFEKDANLLHVKVDVTDKSTPAPAPTFRSKETGAEESTQKTTSYDLCIPASEIDLSLKDLNIEITGNNIEKVEDKLNLLYEIGIDEKITNKSVEFKWDKTNPTVDEILTKLNWKQESASLNDGEKINLNSNKIAQDLNLFNVKFSNPSANMEDKTFKLDVEPESDFYWENGTNDKKTLTVANIVILQKAEIRKLSGSALTHSIEVQSAGFVSADDYFEKYKEEIKNKLNQDVAVNATIEYKKDESGAEKTNTKTIKCIATANKGAMFEDDSTTKEFDLTLNFNVVKQKVTLNEEINVVGKLSDVSKSTDINTKVSTVLQDNKDKVIKGYEESKHKDLNVTIADFASTDNGNWGSTTYEEWNKKDAKNGETPLEKMYYDGGKLEVKSLNELHDKISAKIAELNKPAKSDEAAATVKYEIVSGTAIGVDEENDLLHINVQKTETKNEQQKNEPTVTKYDYCLPASSITYVKEKANITVKGTHFEDNNSKTSTVKFQIGAKFKDTFNNLKSSEIIVEKNDALVDTFNEKDVMVALGWASYKAAENEDQKTDSEITIDNKKISKELNIHNATFNVDKLTKNEATKAETTYKLTLKAQPNSGFVWDDGSNKEKTITIDGLKISAKGAYLKQNTTKYGEDVDAGNETIETYLSKEDKKYLKELQNKIQESLTKKDSGKVITSDVFLKNATIKSLNVEETKKANQESEASEEESIYAETGASSKEVKLVFDIAANDGFVFSDDKTKTKKLTVTVKFTNVGADSEPGEEEDPEVEGEESQTPQEPQHFEIKNLFEIRHKY